MSSPSDRPARSGFPEWYRTIRAFQKHSVPRAVSQLITTLVPLAGFWAVMIVFMNLGFPYWTVLAVVVPAAFFLVRTFIIFHDCCHGSFLKSARANRIVGFLTGVLTFTAFEPWRTDHLRHHATSGQLDHRGFGDVWTMTYEEYAAADRWTRLKYRVYRTPAVMFLLGPFFIFVVVNRMVPKWANARERRSIWAANVGLVVVATTMSLIFGPLTYFAIQIPLILFSGTIGIWLFYVQHQFDPSYWARDAEWNQYEAAVHGSSYYELPAVLRWLTGNIGIHHIHHLRPAIPNYRLWDAYTSTPEAQQVPKLGLWESFKSLRYNLWHEAARRFLSFRQARRLLRGA